MYTYLYIYIHIYIYKLALSFNAVYKFVCTYTIHEHYAYNIIICISLCV